MQLHQQYHPITATPFKQNKTYTEFAPCAALKPYIRCFWGTEKPIAGYAVNAAADIVTPDTCADIIFYVDYTNNRISSSFCGINDRAFRTGSDNGGEDKNGKETVFIFAIRFYAWSVSMFAEESMRDTKNAFFDAGFHFSGIKGRMERLLLDCSDMYRLIPAVEQLLINCYSERHGNPYVLRAVYSMLGKKGNMPIGDLKQWLPISDRQLERLFKEYVGVSPKSLAAMIRYQYLWNEIICSKNFNIGDAVFRYGYSDQPHLLHDFKKYHAMNITDAQKYAYGNVGNLQDMGSLPDIIGAGKEGEEHYGGK